MTREELIKELAKHVSPRDDGLIIDLDLKPFMDILFEYQEKTDFNSKIDGLWGRTAREVFDFYAPINFLAIVTGTFTEDEIVEELKATDIDKFDRAARLLPILNTNKDLIPDIRDLCLKLREANHVMEKDND